MQCSGVAASGKQCRCTKPSGLGFNQPKYKTNTPWFCFRHRDQEASARKVPA